MSAPFNILVLCTGNSARSILAECLLNRLGRGRLRAHSAGSKPAGRVNPFSLELLAAEGHDIGGLRSKSWDEFAQPGAPKMDLVITVCGNAKNETCPVWPGAPVQVHWGFEDPAAVEGSDAEKRAAFRKIHDTIRVQVEKFVALPFEKMDIAGLRRAVLAIAPEDPGQP